MFPMGKGGKGMSKKLVVEVTDAPQGSTNRSLWLKPIINGYS